MSIEEGSSASGKKRGGQFDYMTMEQASKLEARLEEELAEIKSDLESSKNNITRYDEKFSEYEQKDDMVRADKYYNLLQSELESKKTLISQIGRVNNDLSELRESMSKKARMIQEGMLILIPVLLSLCTVSFVVNYYICFMLWCYDVLCLRLISPLIPFLF